MPGPLPKKPHMRQRRNVSPSKRTLEVTEDQRLTFFDLPDDVAHEDEVHHLTVDWWGRLWDSPQVGEFLQGDLGSLLRLASLIDQWWCTKKLNVAREVRVLEREFGLTPLSRRRLEWTVTQVTDKGLTVQNKLEQRVVRSDPRGFLEDDDSSNDS